MPKVLAPVPPFACARMPDVMLPAFKLVSDAPEPANELAVMVPVAVTLATDVMLPEMRALPWMPSAPAGVVDPMPVLPAKKLVAEDEVAYMELVVMVDVAVTAPLAFVERTELTAVPETVREGAEMEAAVSVPVAVMFAAVRFPEKRPLPWTANVPAGDVVPTPTVPKYPVPETVRAVVLAYGKTEATLPVAVY